MRRLLGATVCSVMLIATGLGGAQQQPAKQQPTPPEPQAQQTGQGAMAFVEAQQPSDWMTSVLMGRSVTNAAGESLGEINDLTIDEQGKVVAAVIGVGGFLGIGEKDVGVRYSDLQFEPVPIPEQPRVSPPAATPSEDPKHRDTLIVLDVSKEQLEAAPAYNKLGEKQGAQN